MKVVCEIPNVDTSSALSSSYGSMLSPALTFCGETYLCNQDALYSTRILLDVMVVATTM